MSAPIPPPRASSKANDPKIWSEWRDTEVKLKKSIKSLKQRASEASLTDHEQFRKLKMEEMSEERKILQIEQQRLDARFEADELDFSQFRRLQDDVIRKIEMLMLERWNHNKELRDLEEKAGKVPRLGPDYNFALEAIMYELYKTPGSNTRNKTIQSRMRKEAIGAYEPGLGAPEPGKSRCCITGDYFDTESIKCGHILPCFLSEDLIGYLVGVSPSRHIHSRYNALMMHATAESRFDKGQIVLIPADEKEYPIQRWKIWVLDRSAWNGDMGRGKVGDFHDQEIFFNNENRPAARFVFAHYALSIMRMAKSRTHHYEERLRELAHIRPFATPGKYLRKSLCLTFWYNVNVHHLGELPFQNIIADGALFDEPVRMTGVEEDEVTRKALIETPHISGDDDDDDEINELTRAFRGVYRKKSR